MQMRKKTTTRYACNKNRIIKHNNSDNKCTWINIFAANNDDCLSNT